MKTRILLLPLIASCLFIAQSCCPMKYVLNPAIGEKQSIAVCPDWWIALTKSAILGAESWKDPLGFQAGADFPVTFITNPLSLRAGAMVSLQGASWQEGTLEGRTNLFYAYIPIILRYQHSSGFYGEAGLQPGLLLCAKDKYQGITDNYMDYMNRFDLSVPVVIGYKFKNNIGVNLRVIPGLNDITKDKDVKDRNFVMGLGVSYTWGLNKAKTP